MNRIKHEIDEILEKDHFCLKDIEELFYLSEIYKNLKDEKTDHYIKMTPELAEKWVHHMKNSDGTTGEHWSMDEIENVKNARGITDVSTAVYYAVMNMLYSDYSAALEKYGVGDTPNAWADMTEAWIYDKDAVKNKTSLYYEYIVCK